MDWKKYPPMFIVFHTIFWLLLVWIIFTTFITAGKDSLLLFIPLILMLQRYSSAYRWNVMHRNPLVICMDGTVGVQDSDLQFLHGGMAKLTVSMKKEYVPSDKWYRLSGWDGFMASLGGNVSFDIVDKAERFKQIPIQSCGAKEGAVIYMGSPSGKAPLDIYKEIENKLTQKENELMNIMTQLTRARQLSHAMSNSNNKDMREVSKDLALILRDVGQSVPTQQVMPMPMQGGSYGRNS